MLKELVKQLLRPYPALFNPARRIHSRLYQSIDGFRHWLPMPFVNFVYRRRYRDHWEWAGSVSLEQDQASGYLAPEGSSEKRASVLLDQLESLRPCSVLEFGCGYGRLLRPLREILPDAFIV